VTVRDAERRRDATLDLFAAGATGCGAASADDDELVTIRLTGPNEEIVEVPVGCSSKGCARD
jgi:hypothetical protein